MESLDHVLWLTTPHKKSTKNIEELLSLAELFNIIVDSDRKLILDFYDCGTNARAIFLYLIKAHRGNLDLSIEELNRMYDQYRAWPTNMMALQSAKETLKTMKPGVMILSIRFWLDDKHQFGHVWIFEKLEVSGNQRFLEKSEISGNQGFLEKLPVSGNQRFLEKPFNFSKFSKFNKSRINIYQSALDQYMTMDYYREYGHQIDAQKMLNKVAKLLKIQKWSSNASNLFADIFKFTHGVQMGTKIRPEFFYTYVEY